MGDFRKTVTSTSAAVAFADEDQDVVVSNVGSVPIAIGIGSSVITGGNLLDPGGRRGIKLTSGQSLFAVCASGSTGAVLVNGTQAGTNSNDPLGLGIEAVGTIAPPAGGATQAANRVIYQRILSGGVVTNFRAVVVTQAGNFDMGVYPSNGLAGSAAAPAGPAKWRLGSTAVPVAGALVAATGGITVVKGDWLAFALDGAVASVQRTTTQAVGAAVGAGQYGYADAAFPLPATPVALTSGIVTPIFVYGD